MPRYIFISCPRLAQLSSAQCLTVYIAHRSSLCLLAAALFCHTNNYFYTTLFDRFNHGRSDVALGLFIWSLAASTISYRRYPASAVSARTLFYAPLSVPLYFLHFILISLRLSYFFDCYPPTIRL